MPPDGQVELPKVKDKPAWLVIWRGIPKNLRDAPANRNAGNDELIDFVAFVDPETGQLLGNVSLAGAARLT